MLCCSYLRDKQNLRQCPKPRNCWKDDCNSSHSTLLQDAEKIFPSEPWTNCHNRAARWRRSKTSTWQSSIKTNIDITISVSDTAWSNSWVACSHDNRLGLKRKTLRLTVKGIYVEQMGRHHDGWIVWKISQRSKKWREANIVLGYLYVNTRLGYLYAITRTTYNYAGNLPSIKYRCNPIFFIISRSNKFSIHDFGNSL